MELDLEGLQVAWLAHLMPHYLDLQTGEVIDVYPGQPHPDDPDRYRRIPSRSEESEREDRRAFAAAHPDAMLEHAVDDPSAFRAAVSRDRMIEKAWYGFKNDRATQAMAEWVATLGLG